MLQVHFLEVVDRVNRFRQSVKGVDQGHNLNLAEQQTVRAVRLEQNLERSAVPDGAQLSPHSASVTSHTVHDGADVSELVSEVVLQVFVDVEHFGVENRVAVDQPKNLSKEAVVVIAIGHDIGRLDEIKNRIAREQLQNRLRQKPVVEVDVGESVVELANPLHEQLEAGCHLGSSGRNVLVAQVGRDGRVHSAQKSIEEALSRARVLQVYWEAVLVVNRPPDVVGAFSSVASESLGIVHQIYDIRVLVVVQIAVVEVIAQRVLGVAAVGSGAGPLVTQKAVLVPGDFTARKYFDSTVLGGAEMLVVPELTALVKVDLEVAEVQGTYDGFDQWKYALIKVVDVRKGRVALGGDGSVTKVRQVERCEVAGACGCHKHRQQVDGHCCERHSHNSIMSSDQAISQRLDTSTTLARHFCSYSVYSNY